MKNKKQEQVENKKRHKDGLKRRGEPDLTRSAPSKLEKPVILILCEGENTEKTYFNQFRLTSAHLVTLGKGKGYHTLSLVNEALRLSQLNRMNKFGVSSIRMTSLLKTLMTLLLSLKVMDLAWHIPIKPLNIG